MRPRARGIDVMGEERESEEGVNESERRAGVRSERVCVNECLHAHVCVCMMSICECTGVCASASACMWGEASEASECTAGTSQRR